MKNNKLKILASVLLVFSLSSCTFIFDSSQSTETTTTEDQVTSVVVDPVTLALTIGDKYTIGAHCLPESSNQEVTWRSSKVNVATIDKDTGEIVAKAVGTTKIYATSVSNPRVTGYCSLTVAEQIIHATSVSLDKHELSLNLQGTSYLHCSITPSNATGGYVYSSTNDSVATVTSSGKVTAVGFGTTTIRAVAASDDDIFDECVVTVKKIPVTSVSLDKHTMTVSTGSQTTLTAKVLPSDANDKTLSWYSDNDEIVSVDNTGVIKANKAGTATITVESVDKPEISDSCVFTVEDVHPTSVQMNKAKVSMSLNSTATLDVQFTPTDTSNKNLTWSSSDSSIASVGEVSGTTAKVNSNAFGTCVITATTEDGGLVATSEITVTTLGKTPNLYDYEDLSNHSKYDTDSMPSTGNPKMIVVPVWMTDSSTYIKNETQKANVRADIQKAYFGTNEEAGWRSVKSYYEEESFGQFHLDGVVTDWYNCGYSSTNCSQDNTTSIAIDAARWFKTNNPATYGDYDTNGDGFLDAVILIYAAPDYQTMDSANSNLWAYCYWTRESAGTPGNPNTKAFFWASYDFMYSSNHPSSGGYGGGDTAHCKVDSHTFIHEMGHIFGLNDYYDYNHGYSAAAGFSMQDNNVGAHDPFSKMALNWIEPYVPTETITLSIKPVEAEGDVILLSPEYTGSAFDEYILIELYTSTGLNKFDSDYRYKYPYMYPKGPSSAGCRVWHVDSRLAYWVSGTKFALSTTPEILSTKQYVHAFSNSSFRTPGDGRCSPLAKTATDIYAKGRQLQLIRQNYTKDEMCDDELSESALFKTGDSFDMATYGACFANRGRLNSGKELGFSVHFDSVSNSGATITITKG